jgi:uncharacterized ferredoxin-like protein
MDELNGVNVVAQLMAVSAVTAPKSKGENYVQVKIVSGDDLNRIRDAMKVYEQRTGKTHFERDGENIAKSDALVLIGLKNAAPCGLDCGACGFMTCQDLVRHEPVDVEFKGPVCAYRLIDLGIALGSAVKTASMHNVDSRIMYRVGVAVRDLGLVDWDIILGIPLSVSGKNPFFDRK